MNAYHFILILLTGVFFSCESPKAIQASSLGQSPNMRMKEKSESEPEQSDRMILYSATIEIIVTEPDSIARKIGKIAQKFGGYLSNGSNDFNQIRVKSDQLDNALDELEQLGKLKSRQIFTEDVTELYMDLNIRLENAQKTRNRYLALLEKADQVEEILKIEKELERLNETIDLLKGKINRLENLEAYATINVRLIQKVKPGIFGYVGLGLYKAVAWLFVRA